MTGNPFDDLRRWKDMPHTPAGCFWYFVGFCVLALLWFAFVEWMR